jgi:hypothetical protein
MGAGGSDFARRFAAASSAITAPRELPGTAAIPPSLNEAFLADEKFVAARARCNVGSKGRAVLARLGSCRKQLKSVSYKK